MGNAFSQPQCCPAEAGSESEHPTKAFVTDAMDSIHSQFANIQAQIDIMKQTVNDNGGGGGNGGGNQGYTGGSIHVGMMGCHCQHVANIGEFLDDFSRHALERITALEGMVRVLNGCAGTTSSVAAFAKTNGGNGACHCVHVEDISRRMDQIDATVSGLRGTKHEPRGDTNSAMGGYEPRAQQNAF
jgi:hypothetical protein